MRARRPWWKLFVVVVVTALVVRGGACGMCRSSTPAPDERLAANLRALCAIAEDGIDDPDEGVTRLMRYHGDHGPAMLQAFGELLVTIERIDDDAAHDRRARIARDRLHAPMIACQRTWQEFGEAVEADPVASKKLQRGVDRLGRTLGILLGEDSALRHWPALLRTRVDAALAPR